MRYKRITAAILDIIIFMMLFFSIFSVIPVNENAQKLNIQLNEYTSKNLAELTSAEKNQMMEIAYSLDRETSYMYIIISLVIIIYFILIPKWLNGKTLAQHIRKVKLVRDDGEKPTINQYIIRAMLNSGLILTMLVPLFIYIFNAIWYSNVASILCLLQFIYWIVSFSMLIIKKKTIHDYVTKTKVIEVKR